MTTTRSTRALSDHRALSKRERQAPRPAWYRWSLGKGLFCVIYLLAVHTSGCFWEGRSGLDPDFFDSFGTDAGSGFDAPVENRGGEPVEDGSAFDASVDSGGGETGSAFDASVDSGGGEPVEAGSANDAVTIDDAGYLAEARSSGGACQNADDQAVFDAVNVDAEVETCQLQCAFEAEIGFCTAVCLTAATGLSGACAACYGQLTACNLSNCLDACLNQGASACEWCRIVNCGETFATCTGFE